MVLAGSVRDENYRIWYSDIGEISHLSRDVHFVVDFMGAIPSPPPFETAHGQYLRLMLSLLLV
jgi:hypothetical protein